MTITSQSFPIQKKTSNLLHLLVSTCPLILSSLFTLLVLLPQKYPLTQLRLSRHPPHLYNKLAIPNYNTKALHLLYQLDFSSQFPSLKTVFLKILMNFLGLIHFYLMFDPFLYAPITSSFSLITLLLDVIVAVITTLTAHEEQNDLASINIYNTVWNQSYLHGKKTLGIASVKNTRFRAHLYLLNDW